MQRETRIFYGDLMIAQKLLERDGTVTTEFFYKGCYSLFKSLFDHYYTDCSSCYDLMNEIYLLIITPSKKTGKCQLQNYKGESTLRSWIKSVALIYCYRKYKTRLPLDEEKPSAGEKKLEAGDRNTIETSSFSDVDRKDVMTLISLMPNKRYAKIIQLFYLEHLSNDEVAKELCMTKQNLYYKHRSAKEQFEVVLRKEGRYV